MRAVRIHGPQDIRVDQVEDPTYGPQEVLIDIHGAAICKTDMEIFAGTFPHLRTGLLQLPRIPGHEWSGTVVEVGSQVDKFKPGDRVTGDTAIGCGHCSYCLAGHYNLCPNRQTVGILRKEGAFAEKLVMPQRHVYLLPEEVSLDQAMLTEPAAVAIHAVRRLEPQVGQRCVVFGDGALGLLCLQVVRNAGATDLVMIGSHPHKLSIARDLGASYVIDHKRENFREQVRKWSGGEGPDLIVEASGNPTAIQDAVSLARPGGKIVDISFTGVEQIPLDMDMLVAREISIIGSIANPNAFPAALRLMAEGRLKVDPLISHRFDLDQAPAAFAQIEARQIPYLRVVLQAR